MGIFLIFATYTVCNITYNSGLGDGHRDTCTRILLVVVISLYKWKVYNYNTSKSFTMFSKSALVYTFSDYYTIK